MASNPEVEVLPAPQSHAGNELWLIIGRVIRQSGRSAKRFYAGIGLRFAERLLALTPFLVVYAWLQQTLLLDREGGGIDITDPVVLLFILVALLVLQLLSSFIGSLLCFLGAYDLIGGYREKVIRKVHQLPLSLLHQQRVGQLAEVLTDDVSNLENIFTHLTAELVVSLALPIFLLLLLTWMDPFLALSLALTVPVAFLSLYWAKSTFRKLGLQQQAHRQHTAGLLVEFITAITTIRLFDQSQFWESKLNARFKKMREHSLGIEAWGAGPVQLFRLWVELALVSFLVATAWLLTQPEGFTAQHLSAWLLFVLLAYKFIESLMDAAALITVMRYAGQSEQRIQQLLDSPILSEPSGESTGVMPDKYNIVFENVSFSYRSPNSLDPPEWAIRDISFELPQGTVTAIVGPSGAGKSTLAHLIARFYDPQQGRILLGGIDLRRLGSKGLYQQLSFVFQEVQLYNGSILENVRVSRPEASDEEVIGACRQAYCEAFIQRLPDGYHTLIGEGGQRLSGGERQRLSIARALLKNAPVLLLDEATAAVDVEAQHAIQKALSVLVQGKTVIMIAHRLSTIRNADQILVMQEGCLVEKGQHWQLLTAGKLYARLWQAQQGTLEVFARNNQ